MASVNNSTYRFNRDIFLKASFADRKKELGTDSLDRFEYTGMVGSAKMAEEHLKNADLSQATTLEALKVGVISAVIHHNKEVLPIYLRCMQAAKPAATAAFLNQPWCGTTLLNSAALLSPPEIATALVKAGAKMDLCDSNGFNPITSALFSGNMPTFRELYLEARLDKNALAIQSQAMARVNMATFCGIDGICNDYVSFHSPHAFIADVLQDKGAQHLPTLTHANLESLRLGFSKAASRDHEDSEKLLNRALDGELTLIPTGCQTHAIEVFFYTPKEGPYKDTLFCGICDRSEGAHEETMQIFVVDKGKLKKHHIQALLDGRNFDNMGTLAIPYIHTTFIKEIQKPGPHPKFLESISSFTPKKQTHENCSAASPKAALRAIALLMRATQTDKVSHYQLAKVHNGIKELSTYFRLKSLIAYIEAGGTDQHFINAAQAKINAHSAKDAERQERRKTRQHHLTIL